MGKTTKAKKAMELLFAMLLFLLLLSACDGAETGSVYREGSSHGQPEAQSSPSASPLPSPKPTPLPTPSPTPFPGNVDAAEHSEPLDSEDKFINQTKDMTFEVDGKLCLPGKSVAMVGSLRSFKYSNGEINGKQSIADIAFERQRDLTGIVKVVAYEDEEKGYVMKVYGGSSDEAQLEYLLLPQGLYWTRCSLDSKVFLSELPQLPMKELLEIYPNAILPLGEKEVGWPGGYVRMFWCYEPLYNFRTGSSGVADIVDGEILYHPVKWDGLELEVLMPGEPLFTDIVSVGSMWALAVSFEDSNGVEYIYTAWENGMGGDMSGLILQPINGRILEKTE